MRNSTKGDQDGYTSEGLTIIREIVQAHRGSTKTKKGRTTKHKRQDTGQNSETEDNR